MTEQSPQRRAAATFERMFSAAPEIFIRAPGRVNLIGEHTDYNDGFVLPCAIGPHTIVAARRTGGAAIRVAANDFHDELDCFDPGAPLEKSRYGWANYVRGVVSEAQRAGWPVEGFDIAIAGNIPHGAGLSSSAALEVGVAKLIAMAANGAPRSGKDIALLAQKAEHNFVGMKCGIMDQLACARGEAGHALLIDCRSLDVTPIAAPDNWSILIAHSGIKHTHVGGEYNARRAQCEAAAAALNAPALRDLDTAGLEAARGTLEPIVFKRARHVISENERTLSAARALREADLETLGALMAASHASMRDDFEISTPEIDRLVAIMQDCIGTGGGARMTGGGFGGCVIAIAHAELMSDLKDWVRRQYFGDGDGLILVERPHRGLEVLASGEAPGAA